MKKSGAKKIIIIFHGSCPDGFSAAWAASKKFGAAAEYWPTNHQQKPPPVQGRIVYFLDLVYKPEVMRGIIKSAARVVVIDHHATAKDSVALVKESVYDMKHSAAVLSWRYFHPGKPVPRLLRHVEDEDLWKHVLPHTTAVNARLELVDFNFPAWSAAVRNFERPVPRKKFIAEGELLGNYRTRMVRRLIEEGAAPVKFLGYNILAVNGPRPFTSEIGHALCEMKPPIGIVWHERKGSVAISLRSDGTVDVAKIAQKFGGGGHKAAAAFAWPLGKPKPWKNIADKKGTDKRK